MAVFNDFSYKVAKRIVSGRNTKHAYPLLYKDKVMALITHTFKPQIIPAAKDMAIKGRF